MPPPEKNLLYAQSGGVTAVINATAGSVIQTARRLLPGRVFAARNGILGVLREELYDTGQETDEAINALRHRPGGVFGSCRYKLPDHQEGRQLYDRLFDVFAAHRIHYLLYNGGNDSQDTSDRISRAAGLRNYDLTCIGIPKTVDNDLTVTDSCPGFGSVAKYVATSTLEASLDVASMCETSTRVFILEVMGRHAGWITAACGLAGKNRSEPPHLLLFPEVPFRADRFLELVSQAVQRHGYCVVAASEGCRDAGGQLLADGGSKDAFGHSQLGGVAPRLAQLITAEKGFKCHWAVADYLQRSARHLASATDVEHAVAVGRAAVELALAGENGTMPVILRDSDRPYRWRIGKAQVDSAANLEKKLPPEYMDEDGYGISEACRRYLEPLIAGEEPPPFVDGLPHYSPLKLQRIAPVLTAWEE